MLARSYAGALLGGLCALNLGGCVTLPPNAPRSPQDPWESWNRGVYKVNDKLDRAIAKPVTRAYVKVVPHPIRTGVSNFFANLNTPTVMINDALQGKFLAAANDLGRFVLNSTIGLGGLHPGPFVELPLLGPSDARDAPARLVDAYTNPQAYIHNLWIKYPLYGLYLIDIREGLLSLDDTIKRVYDPYAFVRDAYLQRRAYLVSDGKVSEEPLVDPGDDAPGAAAPGTAAPGTAAPATAPAAVPAPAAPPVPAPTPATPP